MTGQDRKYTSVEVCAGAGGQALGLHNAGFRHHTLIEIDKHACQTLRHNTERLGWDGCRVVEEDLTAFPEKDFNLPEGIDLLAGGVPCPPFSVAGKQLGQADERDLFPVMLKMVDELDPRAVMIENVRGLLEPSHKFQGYREEIVTKLRGMGYTILGWDIYEARDFGVPQLRPRAILVAMKEPEASFYKAPVGNAPVCTVAEALDETMRERFSGSERGRQAYELWRRKAEEKGGVAPTLVGGSKKHGGADLGPTRAKRAWAELGVDAYGVADPHGETKDPERDLFGPRGPKLTVRQAAAIQGFPQEWEFTGRKTAAYRQVGNAFPPPVAQAVGEQIIAALKASDRREEKPAKEVEAPEPFEAEAASVGAAVATSALFPL